MKPTGRAGVLARLGFRAEHETWMLMSALLALCALVVVAVLVLPLFGPRVAAMTAVSVVLGIVVVCHLICVPRVMTTR